MSQCLGTASLSDWYSRKSHIPPRDCTASSAGGSSRGCPGWGCACKATAVCPGRCPCLGWQWRWPGPLSRHSCLSLVTLPPPGSSVPVQWPDSDLLRALFFALPLWLDSPNSQGPACPPALERRHHRSLGRARGLLGLRADGQPRGKALHSSECRIPEGRSS